MASAVTHSPAPKTGDLADMTHHHHVRAGCRGRVRGSHRPYHEGVTSWDLDHVSPEGLEFMTDRHLATLSTIGPDGRIHSVPVGFSYRDGIARVITSGTSQKVANARRDPRATLSQVDGARWLTVSGVARVSDDKDDVALAVELYAARYRQPRVNPLRVAIIVELDRVMGSSGLFVPRPPDD